MNTPTKEQLTDTEGVIDLWWVGIDPREVMEDNGTEYNLEEVRSSAKVLEEYGTETIELLTWWRGYIVASLEETDQKPTVEDFIQATYIVMDIKE